MAWLEHYIRDYPLLGLAKSCVRPEDQLVGPAFKHLNVCVRKTNSLIILDLDAILVFLSLHHVFPEKLYTNFHCHHSISIRFFKVTIRLRNDSLLLRRIRQDDTSKQ
ncbi:hypothetical protein CapIbe_003934 [Capra ibex]